MKRICIALSVAAVCCTFAVKLPGAGAAMAAEKVIHAFGTGSDGQLPTARLTDVKGTLYGTTLSGGIHEKGTVFALDPTTGAEKVLYSFCSQQGCLDGEQPESRLVDAGGTLYGTTYSGGTNSYYGTVFALDPQTRQENVLYSFCSQPNCMDGAAPIAAPIDLNGALYGTTVYGGAYGHGTAFAIDPDTGAETVLYSFCSQQGCMDGEEPLAGLVDVNGMLYGTTAEGGTYGYGTIFVIDPDTGAETVLYSFCGRQNCADGAYPRAALINVNGTLYGTTTSGGAKSYDGTVFAFDPTTNGETVLYSFCEVQKHHICKDGAMPWASLIDVDGTLYGTTIEGGTAINCHDGCGTIFGLDPVTQTEQVVHAFQMNGTDGLEPVAGLVDVGGTLYGTTYYGGAAAAGTVYAVTPEVPGKVRGHQGRE